MFQIFKKGMAVAQKPPQERELYYLSQNDESISLTSPSSGTGFTIGANKKVRILGGVLTKMKAAQKGAVNNPYLGQGEPALEYFLDVRRSKDGGLFLCAVDASGSRILDGALVKIKADHTIYLYKTVNPALGFPLDKEGCIQLD